MATVIRRATTDDVGVLAELRREFTYEDPPPGDPRSDFENAFATTVERGVRDGTWVVWIAEVDGEIVSNAFVAVVPKIPRPVESSEWIGYLTNVYTRPGWRGQALGGRVLDAVTDWAREAGLEVLVVWPSEQSADFYRRHGFDSEDVPLVWTNEAL